MPPGFRRAQDIALSGQGVIGHRHTFLDGQGRRIHITSGVAGAFGEALPVQATVTMAEGTPGYLRGVLSGDTWIIVGGGEHACEPQTITGLGFGREGFMKAAIATGLVVRA